MEIDYGKIGLKCGIEIHQQLTTKKLFCNCPSIIRDDEPDFTVERRLRAVVGETGKVDIAAKKEQHRAKTFLYQGYYDCTCLVELDEEPPRTMNKEALMVAAQIAKMLNADIVDEVQVMRKTVIDGSNTTGFQRTALVARNGILKTSQNDVKIPTICIEEDACKIVERTNDYDIYNLSRLGIPLVEIATDPDIKSPEHARETAELLGMYLRSTGKVKRGLGTIRQDLNISIKHGARIEIKGAQDLKLIPLWVKNECLRQLKLLEIKDELEKRNLTKDVLQDLKAVDVTHILKDTECKFVKKAIDKGSKVYGAKLDKFKGILGMELMPNHRFGTELAGYAKALGFGGIIHSDEDLSKYKFSDNEINSLIKELNVKDNDAFILCVGKENKLKILFNEYLFPRVKRTLTGVPEEVRKPNDDGTTSYLRPMPGAARMYPETDTLPIKINAENIYVPELLSDKIERFKSQYGLSDDLARDLVRTEIDFDNIVKEHPNLKPSFIAETIVSVPKSVKRKFNIEINPSLELFEELFIYLDKGVISKDALLDIMKQINDRALPDIIEDFRLIGDDELEQGLKEIIANNKDVPFKGLIGLAMKKFKGKADGRRLLRC